MASASCAVLLIRKGAGNVRPVTYSDLPEAGPWIAHETLQLAVTTLSLLYAVS